MSEENKNLITCVACEKEIAKNAKSCPHCGAKVKVPFYKKWWVITLAVIVVIGVISNTDGSDKENSETVSTQQTSEKEAETIEYTAYQVSELISDLEDNALKAETKYENQYVELTGKLSIIDSDGKYISLVPSNDEFTLINVQCYIKNDEQKAQVAEFSKGDSITVKGKIKSIGEVFGYSLDIDSIQ